MVSACGRVAVGTETPPKDILVKLHLECKSLSWVRGHLSVLFILFPLTSPLCP